MQKRIIKLLQEFVQLNLICEAPVPLRAPTTQEQKIAFIRLVTWAAQKMQVDKETLKKALEDAGSEDWGLAIELLRDYYVLKGIKFRAA